MQQNNWLIAPKEPPCSTGLISSTNLGTQTEKAPKAAPQINRPTQITFKFIVTSEIATPMQRSRFRATMRRSLPNDITLEQERAPIIAPNIVIL